MKKIQQIRLQAEDAISHNRFDQSLSMLDSGLELMPRIRAGEAAGEGAKGEGKQDQINEFVQQAETARRKGDFKSAIAAAQKALKVDKTNPRIVASATFLPKRRNRPSATPGQGAAGFRARRDQLPPL